MKKLLFLIVVLVCAGIAQAQVSSQNARRIYSGTAVPNWSCSPGPTFTDFYLRTTTDVLYYCSAAPSTWTVFVAAGTGGSVTSVSVVTANGFSGSVATSTTTPAITINNPSALVATTSIASPFFVSTAANPADAGAVRLGNTELLAWEAATPGTDLTLGVNSSDILASSAGFTAPTLNGLIVTNNGTNTLNIAAGKTVVVSNGITFAGTDSTVMTFPSTTATVARTDAGQTFTGTQAFGAVTASTFTGPTVGVPTNSSAAAGQVGEHITATLASTGVVLTSTVSLTLTSISLTAGDWDVSYVCYFRTAASTNVTRLISSMSLVDNTFDVTEGRHTDTVFPSTVLTQGQQTYSIPSVRMSLASTTTIYLVANGTFTVSTLNAWGNIHARRVR